jgi:hypothetical protein
MFETVMETNRKTAENMSDLWTWITIDDGGNVIVEPKTMTQVDLFGSLPEINPKFFNNFGADEINIRQKNGTLIIIKRVR